MSKSSKRLKEKDMVELRKAQHQATLMNHFKWVKWMREAYPYAMAMKMARYLGFQKPSILFYYRMRQLGQDRLNVSSIPSSPSLHWGLVNDVEVL